MADDSSPPGDWIAARGWAYSEFAATVRRASFRLRLEPDDVAEAVQSVYLDIGRALAGPSPPDVPTPDRLQGYVFTSSLRWFHALLKQRGEARNKNPQVDAAGADEHAVQKRRRLADKPAQRELQAEVPDQMEALFALLPDGPPPPPLREVARQAAQGRSQVDIARAFGVSTPTISRRMREAMEYARECAGSVVRQTDATEL